MKCQVCNKKKATVHLTEIVDGQMTEMHICEDCAREKSTQMEQQFGLADLLAGLTDFNKNVKGPQPEVIKCSSCGMSYNDFKKYGRLGCSECYSSFETQLAGLLKKIHGSTRHLGKSPVCAHPTVSPEKPLTVDDLRQQLQSSILEEDYERAAEIRDKIRELENKG